MAWTIRSPRDANHNPEVVVNGQPGRGPISIDAVVGTPSRSTPRARATPMGTRCAIAWCFYPEAGAGIPGAPR